MKKLLIFLFILNLAAPARAAWDSTKPANNEKLADAPAQIRANWAAIEAGTDANLKITNAKVADNAGIVDTKLAQISTAAKVSGTALTGLASIPAGAGVIPTANCPTIDTLLPSQTGNSGKTLITNGSTGSWGYPAGLTIASQAQGDVLIYNGSAWVRLAPGTAGQVLKTGGAGANPAWGLSADLAIASQAQGDILYFNGTNWVRLAAGTSGYFLKTLGAGQNPAWAAAGSICNGGAVTVGASSYSTITFSRAFPDTNYGVVATRDDGQAGGITVSNKSTSGCRINNANAGNVPVHWVATQN